MEIRCNKTVLRKYSDCVLLHYKGSTLRFKDMGEFYSFLNQVEGVKEMLEAEVDSSEE